MSRSLLDHNEGMRIRRAGLGLLFVVLVSAACGSRTGLFGPEDASAPTLDGSVQDARNDAPTDGAADARPDAGDLDALPPIDSAQTPDVVNRTDCPDASGTLVYVVTSRNELYAFYPPDLGFRLVGTLACPAGDATPFSMAVDRRGVAYVLFTDGNLFQVSTQTAACIATPFRPGQSGFTTFGMGFAADSLAPGLERLFVADSSGGFGIPTGSRLGSIDTAGFALSLIGPFVPTLPRAELTGTADGRLFAYWPNGTAAVPRGSIAEVDARTGAVRARTDVPVGTSQDAFAFAFYGGDFWMFNSADGTSSEVSRYRLADGATTTPVTFPETIVGAGVSTCAPSQ